MREETLREEAKLLLHAAYAACKRGDGLCVDLAQGAYQRGLSNNAPHLAALVVMMEVVGWVENDPLCHRARFRRLISERGLEVLSEA